MAERLVDPIIEKLIDTCSKYLEDQVRWQTGMKEELQRLRENHPKIQAVVFASRREQIKDLNPALNEWLWQLRDAIDEADDVMDELDYMELQKQVTKNKKQRKVRSIMKSINKRLFKIVKRALKIDPNLKRLEEAVQKLDRVSAGVGTFLYLVNDLKQEQQEQQLEFYRERETGPLPINDQIGRGKEKEFVMRWLRNPTNECQTTLYSNISLLSIVGLGGMGKTTLLQHVYQDEILTNDFDLKIWVCVSNNFQAQKVIADMLEYLRKERPRADAIGTLQESLKSEVSSKKFLLVLDDIWEEEEERDKSKWKKILAPLASGSLGSKILITTRMESVALMIEKVINKKTETLKLEGLKEEECLQLLNKYAFVNVKNHTTYHNLKSIAEKIVKKLLGSPLAARVIGGVLNTHMDERHWKSVLNYDIGGQNDIMSVLKLSYIFLPKDLQNCFSLCCMFPQDYEYDKDDSIHMWIALGFIPPPYNQEETIKDVGERYFDILVKKSLFDKFQTKDKTYFKLHDLLHDLLRSISAQEYFNVEDDEELLFKIPKTVRHLSINCGIFVLKNILEFKKFKNLRSLYMSGDLNFCSILPTIFKTSRSIRLLHLSSPCSQWIPEEIGHLIHLRYLKICNVVTHFPRSLSKLYHLQFMVYHQDKFIHEDNFNYDLSDNLPRDMHDLPKISYLKCPFPGMQEIGKLNSLQELDGFYVKNRTGYSISELEHMNELRLLVVNCLQNVEDANEACNAKLCNKRSLMDLSLVWPGIENRYDYKRIVEIALAEEVLDNLQPHDSLKKLKIDSYNGARSAIWLNNIDWISNLEYIDLKNCLEWQILPPFGQLPSLKSLYLCNMPKVKQLDYKAHGNDKHCVFPLLQVLHITNLEKLEDWFDATAAANDRLFPCLIELYLAGCPKLQELPFLPPNLEKLKIYYIGWEACNWLQGTCNCCSISIKNLPDLRSLTGLQQVEPTGNCQLILSELVIEDPSMLLMKPLRGIASLQRLVIESNNELVSFSNEEEQWFLQVRSSLCKLEFNFLKLLKSLPSSLESLSSLKILRVYYVPQLQLLPNIPASLEELHLIDLKSLRFLPSSLESLSSLKILYVKTVPQLQLLPNIPASLEQLQLLNLESLRSLPSSLENISSLKVICVVNIPQVQLLPNIPASLEQLSLDRLEALGSLPSLSFSSLKNLELCDIPLQKLPDLPPSLCELTLDGLSELDCLPSCLSSLSSLQKLTIEHSPLLREVVDLPHSLKHLSIAHCHPELLERYERSRDHSLMSSVCY